MSPWASARNWRLRRNRNQRRSWRATFLKRKVTGLEEQVKALKEGKAFLFKDSAPAVSRQGSGKPGYKPKAGETSGGGWAKTVAESLNKETSKNPYADAWATK